MPFQRDVIAGLFGGRVTGEFHTVASAGNQLRRPGSGQDGPEAERLRCRELGRIGEMSRLLGRSLPWLRSRRRQSID